MEDTPVLKVKNKTFAQIKRSLNDYTTEIGNGKCKCVCGGEFLIKYKSKHNRTLNHKDYFEQELHLNPLPLPTISQEIQEIPIPDVEPELIQEIPPPVPDTQPTKAEIAKQKKQDYMREYMKKYHAKRYNEDPAYREYRKNMTTKSTCKMGSRYVKAYQYLKQHNINIFDENGN